MTGSQTPSAAKLLAAQEQAKAARTETVRAAWGKLPATFRLSLPRFDGKRRDAVC